jgi:hypothetical protein
MYINNNSFNATAFSFIQPSLVHINHVKTTGTQSTSALNILASDSTSTSIAGLNQSTATPRSRRTQGSTRLGSVVEDDSEREERSHTHSHSHSTSTSNIHGDSKEGLEGLLGMISSRTPRKERHNDKGKSTDALSEEDLRAAVGDVSIAIFLTSLVHCIYADDTDPVPAIIRTPASGCFTEYRADIRLFVCWIIKHNDIRARRCGA